MLADRITANAQVFESSEEALRTEERIKDQLCQELNLLVQQSAHAQIEKLEQLTQRLEYLNQVISQPPCRFDTWPSRGRHGYNHSRHVVETLHLSRLVRPRRA